MEMLINCQLYGKFNLQSIFYYPAYITRPENIASIIQDKIITKSLLLNHTSYRESNYIKIRPTFNGPFLLVSHLFRVPPIKIILQQLGGPCMQEGRHHRSWRGHCPLVWENPWEYSISGSQNRSAGVCPHFQNRGATLACMNYTTGAPGPRDRSNSGIVSTCAALQVYFEFW